MGKGLRSKVKKRFRAIKAKEVEAHELEKLQQLVVKMDEVRNAPVEIQMETKDEIGQQIAPMIVQNLKKPKVSISMEMEVDQGSKEKSKLSSNISKKSKSRRKKSHSRGS